MCTSVCSVSDELKSVYCAVCLRSTLFCMDTVNCEQAMDKTKCRALGKKADTLTLLLNTVIIV